MTSPKTSVSLALAVGLFLTACGTETAPHPRIKLADRETGTLELAPDDQAPVVLLNATFPEGASTEDWRAVESAAAPFERTGRLEVAVESDEQDSYLSLSGSTGFVFQVIEVEPSTAYRFEAVLRARGIAPEEVLDSNGDPAEYFPARPWLAELSRFDDAETILRAGVDSLIEKRHLFPSSVREEGWHTREKLFRTSPETRALIVACTLGLSESIDAGQVDFRELTVERISDKRLHEDLLRRESASFKRGEPSASGWRAERRIRTQLGAELRPAFVLFPGDTLTMELEVPSGEPLLELGFGPWRTALRDSYATGTPRDQVFLVRVDGDDLMRRSATAPASLGETRWEDVSLDLSSYRNETVSIEFSVEGSLPAVFGAPSLRDASFSSDRPNLILVSIDTLRADRLGSYGYSENGRSTSPRLDELAAQSVLFKNTSSQAPYTLPSHTTMFSGQFPSVHGIQKGGQMISIERTPLLARILSDRGYRTLAMTGGGFLNADFGFDQGFDGFTVIDPLRHPDSRYLTQLSREFPERFSDDLIRANGMERVDRFLEDNRDDPFFLFLHTYTVHDYDPPESHQRCRERGCTYERTDWREFRLIPHEDPEVAWTPAPSTAEDRAHLSHRYDDALTFVDELLGNMLDRLEELGLDENTIVVITTDHGEEMLDRGFVQHGKTLYEEVTGIPLFMRVPGLAPRVEESPAMTVDITPTLLWKMGIPPESNMQGIDLLSDSINERAIWSEIHDTFVHKYTLREEGWKLIHNPEDEDIIFPSPDEWELYDLVSDPDERKNLALENGDRLDALREQLERHRQIFEAISEQLGDVGEGEIDPGTQAQLKALGY